jgi:glycine cleavage system H protein
LEAVREIRYRRVRFSARLPVDRRYTASHYWALEVEPSLWRVGFTRFATRMLGDLVELGWEAAARDPITVGCTLGSVEGFKAVTEVYSIISGAFLRWNPELDQDITLTDTEPFGRGWLYEANGAPEANSMDVHEYVALLDRTIDRMTGRTPKGEDA